MHKRRREEGPKVSLSEGVLREQQILHKLGVDLKCCINHHVECQEWHYRRNRRSVVHEFDVILFPGFSLQLLGDYTTTGTGGALFGALQDAGGLAGLAIIADATVRAPLSLALAGGALYGTLPGTLRALAAS